MPKMYRYLLGKPPLAHAEHHAPLAMHSYCSCCTSHHFMMQQNTDLCPDNGESACSNSLMLPLSVLLSCPCTIQRYALNLVLAAKVFLLFSPYPAEPDTCTTVTFSGPGVGVPPTAGTASLLQWSPLAVTLGMTIACFLQI